MRGKSGKHRRKWRGKGKEEREGRRRKEKKEIWRTKKGRRNGGG